MSVLNNSSVLLLADAAAPTGYNIERSLRFNSSDSAYLSRTPSTAGNRKTWTWAGWVKRSGLGARMGLFAADNATSPYFFIELFSDNRIKLEKGSANGYSVAVFRDASAWCHILLAVDTTQATASARQRLYVNGVEQSIDTFFAQNEDTAVNLNGAVHTIGSLHYSTPNSYFSGYLADIHFIDSQALTPSSFGEFDTNGVWQPKAYTGSYGTNGFKLNFSNNSAATAAALGADSSGNGNNWTPNNLSVTAGAGNDSLVDTPTSYGTDTGAGGVRGNYATLNPLAGTGSLANGNLDFTSSGSGFRSSTIGISSGKWYWEALLGSTPTNTYVGLYSNPNNEFANSVITGTGGNRQTNAGGSFTVTSNTFQAGDIFGVAADLDAGTVTWYRNGSVAVTLTGATLNTATWYPGTNVNAAASTAIVYNFGQRPFAYTAPSGFKALCDTNLPAPVVAKPSTVMDVALWTGNGSARSITGLGFSPDFVWIKGRSGATDHALYDAVRGVQKDLVSNSTAAETTQTTGLTAFNSDGFSIGTLAKLNTNAATYAGWVWDAGTTTSSNPDGSITSTVSVRANASAGFSVVTYTGTGVNCTVGHGLGVAPGMIIVKRRDTTANWQVRHTSIAAASSIQLNLTNAAASATTVWNSTAPTSTVFSIGTDATVNASGGTYVAYCFAPVAGYSSFGSYTGNGSADGPFVYTGFRPRWLMIKCSSIGDAFQHWHLFDTSRSPINMSKERLKANASDSEDSFSVIDLLSSGFKIRYTDGYFNQNGSTWIYAAFAEHPFATSRAR